jgi:hypothetical protein
MVKSLLLLGVLLLAAPAWSKSTVTDLFAHQYFQMKNSDAKNPPPNCRPTSSCFKVACDLLGQFECDDIQEQNQIRNACRGVWGGDCISNATNLLHKFEYDDLEEMVQLVQSCSGVFDLECVNYSCQRMGRFGCDDLEEVVQVNRSCARAYPFYN